MFEESSSSSRSAALSSRDRILCAAKRLFADQGYENATTMAIARAAGTSETQILKKFGSKEGLLEAILDADWDTIGEELTSIANTSVSPVERLKLLIGHMVRHMDGDNQLKKLMAVEFGRIRRKQGHEILITGGYLHSAAMLDGLFEEMRRGGQMRSDIEPRTARSALFGTMANLWWDQLQAPHDTAFSSERIILMTDLFLASLAPLANGCKAGQC